jgi:hypothetical protein
MRTKNSFWGFINRPSDTNVLQIERIRIAMLNALDVHCADAHSSLDSSIRFASDLEALWYLRPDLLSAIASCRDQGAATKVLQDISMLFRGHLPQADLSRFGKI